MRTRLRKGLVVLVVLTLGLYFVVACGSDEPTEDTAETTATADVEEAAETTTTNEATEDAEATTTTVEEDGSGGEYGVVSEVVSDESTEKITVWAPDAEGSWPLVFAVGGPQGSAKFDFNVLATELASHGVVVIATDWQRVGAREADIRSDQSQGLPATLVTDSECGFRFALEIAGDYRADLTQPVTMVGYDKGGTGILYQSIDEAQYGPEGTFGDYFSGVPRPEVVVAISGCYVQNGFPSELEAWGNLDAAFTVIVGSEAGMSQEEYDAQQSWQPYERDYTSCVKGEAEQTATDLQSQGYDVTLVEVPDAGHSEVIFRDESGSLPPDHPAGQQTVQTILDAIAAAQA